MDRPQQTVVVVGAGMSGLVSCRWLLEEGIIPLVFESSSHIGGLWCYNPDPSVHSCYKGLRTNTHRDGTSFRDFPMPADYPDHPTNEQIYEYFQSYCSHFGLEKYITFGATVQSVQQIQNLSEPRQYPNAKWKVIVDISGTIEEYVVDGVAICNGHHWSEIIPTESDIPGLSSFTGTTLHSHQYRTPEDFRGKRVLVSGVGISGHDIIRELQETDSTLVSSSRRITPRGPDGLVEKIISKISPTDAEEDPVRPAIESISGLNVTFQDGSVYKNVDAIIWCWGYRYSFPFLKDHVPIIDCPSRVPLYKFVFAPNLEGLAFIGLPTVNGSLHPIAERQAIWFSGLLKGNFHLPSKAQMEKWIFDWDQSIIGYRVQYRPMQVNGLTYLKEEIE